MTVTDNLRDQSRGARSSYRADQVGSFLRPMHLLEARNAQREGRISADDLRRIEDEAILALLEMQREVGIDVVTDGELRRATYQAVLADSVDGIIPGEKTILEWRTPTGRVTEERTQGVVGAVLKQNRRLVKHETDFLKQHAAGPFKVALPSPMLQAMGHFKQGITDAFYKDHWELLWAIGKIVRGEVKALADEGVPYIQVDAPTYTHTFDEGRRAQLRADGVDPDRALEEGIAVDNYLLQDARQAGVTTGIHLCRGNSRSRWLAEGSYEPIAEKLLGSLQVDRFLLEYDSDRAGGFEPLRFLPKDKTVVLGLITTKKGDLENQDDILRRVDEASKYVPVERLALSPQCGFASVAYGNELTPDQQRQKLELVVDTARKVWT